MPLSSFPISRPLLAPMPYRRLSPAERAQRQQELADGTFANAVADRLIYCQMRDKQLNNLRKKSAAKKQTQRGGRRAPTLYIDNETPAEFIPLSEL